MSHVSIKWQRIAYCRPREDTDGVRRPPFLRGSAHSTSVFGLTKNEVDASSISLAFRPVLRILIANVVAEFILGTKAIDFLLSQLAFVYRTLASKDAPHNVFSIFGSKLKPSRRNDMMESHLKNKNHKIIIMIKELYPRQHKKASGKPSPM